MIEKAIGAAVGFVLVLLALSAFMALPVYFLWNALVPGIFGLGTITFMQAWGLNILCSCLFKPVTVKN